MGCWSHHFCTQTHLRGLCLSRKIYLSRQQGISPSRTSCWDTHLLRNIHQLTNSPSFPPMTGCGMSLVLLLTVQMEIKETNTNLCNFWIFHSQERSNRKGATSRPVSIHPANAFEDFRMGKKIERWKGVPSPILESHYIWSNSYNSKWWHIALRVRLVQHCSLHVEQNNSILNALLVVKELAQIILSGSCLRISSAQFFSTHARIRVDQIEKQRIIAATAVCLRSGATPCRTAYHQ